MKWQGCALRHPHLPLAPFHLQTFTPYVDTSFRYPTVKREPLYIADTSYYICSFAELRPLLSTTEYRLYRLLATITMMRTPPWRWTLGDCSCSHVHTFDASIASQHCRPGAHIPFAVLGPYCPHTRVKIPRICGA